jgi:hypothetical protein
MMQIINCEQGSEEWFRARAGMPTASEFATVMAKGEGKTRRTYLLKLAGEIITGEPMERYSNDYMERGHLMEVEARDFYAFINDVEPVQIGFIVNGRKGCSPDALIGADGMLELKTKAPHLLAECILRDSFPPEHRAQCQGALWVAEREWIDLSCYWPRMPTFVKRAYRDEAYIAEIAAAVDQFNDELAAMVERIRSYGTSTEKAA